METHYRQALRIAKELHKVVPKHRGAARNPNVILRCTSLVDRISAAVTMFAEDGAVIKDLLRTVYSDDLHKRVIGGAPLVHANVLRRIDRIIHKADKEASVIAAMRQASDGPDRS